ncbi:MAG: hypothetical protein ACK55I_04145, partial [bacterium]
LQRSPAQQRAMHHLVGGNQQQGIGHACQQHHKAASKPRRQEPVGGDCSNQQQQQAQQATSRRQPLNPSYWSMQIGHSLDQQQVQLPDPLPAGRRNRVVRMAHNLRRT